MRYITCTNCAVDKATCPRRAQIREAIAGCGFNSAKFTCKERKAMFRPGQRVNVRWDFWERGGDGDLESCWHLTFKATVMSEAGLKFIIRVDPDQEWDDFKPADVFRNENLIVKARPSDMTATGEPDITLCKDCGGLPQWGTCLANAGNPADECRVKDLAGIEISWP